MHENTRDFLKFGYKELDEAGDLLKALKTKKDKTKFLGHGVAVEFNLNSGNVFLVDEDFNVAMMNGENLEDFFSCPQCGHEGFLEDMDHFDETGEQECVEYFNSINE